MVPFMWSINRMIASEVTDLPDPLSPTIASVWPGATAKDTSSTTRFDPKRTLRERTSSRGPSSW